MSVSKRQLMGNSPEFLVVVRTADLLAPTDATVLLSGESGTGKELIVTSFEIRGTSSHDQAWVPDGAHGRS
ncbi:MAG: Sigma-54 interaction domain-containing protein [Candidatus Kentron sp. G]|nr:MAG: Sigma-54 interaction domain-containing protein [Candidatus Kentron sp. G]VFN07457.1 MAG: Sigma-54 interaction domain-containing protein [Candidatus Kentron sp. G]